MANLADYRPGISATAARFGAVFLARAADRLDEKLDDPNVELPEVTRQIVEAFISSADALVDELDKVAQQQKVVRMSELQSAATAQKEEPALARR